MGEIKCKGCKFLNKSVYDPKCGLYGGELFCESPAWEHNIENWDFELFMIYNREFKCPFRVDIKTKTKNIMRINNGKE